MKLIIKLTLSLLVITTTFFNVYSQCSTIFTTALPTTAQNAGVTFTSQAGKYAILNVTAGKAYEIRSFATNGSQISQNFCVREGTYNGSIVAQGGMNGANGFVYVAQSTGLAYIHIYTQMCGTSTTNRNVTVVDITTGYNTANSLPYTQGFNSTTIPVGNWYGYPIIMATASTSTQSKITGLASGANVSSTPYEGTNYIRFNSYTCDATATARLVSPAISTVGTSSVDVEFYWGEDNVYTANDKVRVQYSTDGNTWTSVGSDFLRYSSSAGSSATWSKKTVTLPAGAGNQSKIYVGFLFTSDWGGNCSFDKVTVKTTPTCFEPTNLTSSNITTTTTTISWTAPASAPANGYDYYLSTTNTAPTAGTTPTGSVIAGTTSVNLTSLNSCTTYYIWVRSKCSASDLSSWTASSFSFITATQPGTLSSNKTVTTVNDAIVLTTSGNSGTITKLQWSYDNFTNVVGTVNNPANPYTLILNVQQPTIWFRTTSVNGSCPANSTTPISVTLTSAPPFIYGTSGGDYISNVTLNTLNNNSTYDTPAGDAYQDFTNLTTTLIRGSNYTIYVSSPSTFMGLPSGYAAWIDFNNDGVYDVSENIMQKSYGTTKSQSFTVPSNAALATIKMRVLSAWASTPSTDAYYSTGYDYGEIEEYKINISSPLPIELYSFDGVSNGENNYIFWVTASEENTSHYNLQKSRDGETWVTISTISAAGNSTTKIEYDVIDYKVENIINYYRIQQYDNDGIYDTFGPISINNMNSDSFKTIIKYINLNGQEIDPSKVGFMDLYIEVYSDGSMRKVIK